MAVNHKLTNVVKDRVVEHFLLNGFGTPDQFR